MDIALTVRHLRLRLGLLLALLAGAVGPLLAQTPPDLNRVEFFLDADPGHGLGTAVTLPGAAAPTRLGLTFPVPLGGLAPGFHRLFIRSRDANNQWSQTFARLFFVDDNSAITAPNLAEVEHFLDTDPGFGNGSSTALTGTSALNRTVPVSIGSLAPGFHRLFMRTRDVNNKWSQTFARLFFVDDNSALVAPNLAEVEHFLDTDPGFGNGSSTALTGTSVLGRTIPVSLASLSPGFHRLFMRTRDVNNKWSQTFARLFFVDDNSALVAPNLARAEFYFDTDPGFGSGTAIATGAAAPSYTALPVAADASALADGPHRLFVRVQDANGRWSQVLNRAFVRSGCTASANFAENRPAASYAGNLGAAAAEAVFNGLGVANFNNNNTVQADLGAATRTVSEAQAGLRNPNGTAVSGTLTLEISLNGSTFSTAGSVPVALAASQAAPQRVVLPLAVAVAGVRAVRLRLTLPSGLGQAIQMTDAGVYFFNCTSPVITSFLPASGPVGTSVTITGTNLGGVTAVRFNGVAAAVFSGVSATSVTATVPAGASTGPISLTTANGTAVSGSNFTVVVLAPTIASFTPATGPVGTSVTITGTDLSTTTAVRFNGVVATTFAVANSTTVLATVPAGATTGVISITTAGGTGSSATDFTVLQPPVVASFAPASGPVGTSVVITGANFSGAVFVRFNGSSASGFVVNSATQITANVPAGASTGPVRVTTFIGSGESASNFTVTAPVPTIASFAPGSGAAGSGAAATSVTITGTNLTGATALTFNGLAATFVVNSATSITATVPVGATTGPVRVTTPNGTGSGAGVFRVLPLGVVTGAQAVRYDFGDAGQALDLSGNGRDGTLAGGASIGGGALTIGANALDALALPGATLNGALDFTITATARMAAFVAFNELLTATQSGGNDLGVYYESGASRWGLTLNGVEHTFGPFVAALNTPYRVVVARRGSQASFFVDGVQVGATITVSASAIPVAATGLVLGQEQDAVGGGFDASQAWTGSIDEIAFYRSALTPLTPGAALTIPYTVTGPGFALLNTFEVQLSNAVGSFANPLRLGTGLGTLFSSSLNTIMPAVPNGTGYRIRVVALTPALTGSDDGASPVVVVGGTPPTIASFAPGSGPVGTSVVITGTNLTGATALTFNGLAATFVVNSGTSITATVPAGATTGPIGVATPGGGTSSATSFTVTVPAAPAPTIASFAPASGPVGTSVVVTGSNFTGATALTFNGLAATFVVNSATSITATVPAGATSGPIGVTAPGGSGSSAGSFTVLAPLPTVTAFTPTSGAAGTSVVITGTDFTGTTAVRFNGVLASGFVVNSATQITVSVPTFASTGPVRVTTGSGSGQSAASFTVPAPAPTITSFSPASGPVGTSVLLTGTGFSGTTAVTFNSLAASFVVNSSTSITATVPVGATTGVILVTTPGGIVSSGGSGGSFIVTAAPAVASIATAAFGGAFCAGASLGVAFVASGFAAGNVFTAQLSDANGLFAAPVSLGTLPGTGSGSIAGVIPPGTAAGGGYRVRVVGSGPATTGSDNGSNLTVSAFGLTAWTGAAGTGNWFEPGNWSCGQLPTAASDVAIPAGLPRYPVLPASGPVPAARNLAIASGASLTLGTGLNLSGNLLNNGTLNAGSSTVALVGTAPQTLGGGGGTTLFDLTVNNPAGATLLARLAVRRLLTLTAGNLASGNLLTLRSDASGTAMVVNPPGGGLVTGPATMERFINNASGAGYRHYASPMQAGSANVGEFAEDLPGFELNLNYNTLGNTVSPFPTFFAYDETRLNAAAVDNFDQGWRVPAAVEALVPGRGYTAQSANADVVDINGFLAHADVNLTLTRGAFANSGWHLLGNPFPSPLDWDLVPAAPGIGRALYVFVPSGPYTGSYRSYLPNPVAGQPGIGQNGGTKDLAAMQGYFVRATAPNAAFVLPAAARATAYANPVFARGGASADTRPLLRLQVANAAGQADETVVYFDPAAGTGFSPAHDAYLVQRNGSGFPSLWSEAGGTTSGASGPLALSINGLPDVRQAPSIPLGVRVSVSGPHTLTAPALLNLPAGTEVWLEDQALGRRHNLSQQPSYAFQMAASFRGPRFVLWLQQRPTGTASAALQANLRLYPNPATSTATVELAGATGPVELTLRNVLGQVVRRRTATPRAGALREELDLRELPAGVYLLHVSTAAGHATQRLLRE